MDPSIPSVADRSTRPSLPGRAVRLLIVLLLTYGLLELGAYAVGVVRTGSARPQAVWSEARSELLALGAPGDAAAPARPTGVNERPDVLHPYVGFLAELESGAAPPDALALNHVEFYAPDAPLYRPSPERLVIAITGGSVAAQFVAGPGATRLGELLTREPAYRGREPLFVNLATNGFKQPQQLMAVAYALTLGAHFDLVLNLDGFNEVALHAPENGRKGVFPSYPRGWYFRSGKAPDPEILPRVGRIALAEQERLEAARGAERGGWHALPLAQLLWFARDRGLQAEIAAQKGALREVKPRRRDPRRTGPKVDFGGDEALYLHLAETWARASRQLHHLCRGNGIRYHHFLQPNQYVEGSKPLSAEERAEAYNEAQPYRPGVLAGYPMLEALGADLVSEGVPFLDLTTLFRQVEATLYVDDCCHLNERGNLLMAEAMAAALLD